ncbi:MAG: DUF4255 domain-containing protein, partial [Acidimicrobiia bacterium]|nr:DUF4255 domain-containing protein [Acidimicrobiia bacterium]
ADPPTISLFLYHVAPNPMLRNEDLPTRDATGQVVLKKPAAALDLQYLLSFTGNDQELEPQLLLGAALRDLHAHPVLTHDDIADAVKDHEPPILPHPGLSVSDLIESVRLYPLALSIEERSKLWSVFFQAPYRLSVEYGATVVMIEKDDPVTTYPPPTYARMSPRPDVPSASTGLPERTLEPLPPLPGTLQPHHAAIQDLQLAMAATSRAAAELGIGQDTATVTAAVREAQRAIAGVVADLQSAPRPRASDVVEP